MTSSELGRDVVILTCAVSAGIHGALAPAHFDESIGAGVGFVAATVLLSAAAVALTVLPASAIALAGAMFVLAGLLAGYVLAATTGLPLIHPASEPVDGLALATKAIEALGLFVTSNLLKGTLTWTRRAATVPFPSL
jgi:hypothetical protein